MTIRTIFGSPVKIIGRAAPFCEHERVKIEYIEDGVRDIILVDYLQPKAEVKQAIRGLNK